jgi:hypothetical protein
MRMVALEVKELFSFDELSLEGLPRGAFVVVGPNGAGKTNLFRLIEVVRTAIERATTFSPESYTRLVQFASGRRIEAAPGRESGIRLRVACTEEWERDLIVRFVRAALFAALLKDTPNNFDKTGVLAWVNSIHADDLTALATGWIVVDLTDPETGQWSLGYEFDFEDERFRLILNASVSMGALVHVQDAKHVVSGQPVAPGLEPDPDTRIPGQPFSLSRLLPPRHEARTFVIDPGQLGSEEPIRAWGAVAGIGTDEVGRQSYGMAWVLRVLLERGIAMLGDARIPPRLTYSAAEAGFDPDPADGSGVPLRLFRMKNGDSAERRQFASIQAMFERLTGQEFDVGLAEGVRSSAEDPAALRVSPIVVRSGRDLSMEFAGAGMWETLLLSATLSESAGRVVVLDEPARNLHPTLQRRLLSELRTARGQLLVTTHSPYLVPASSDAETQICRVALDAGVSRAHFLPEADDEGRLQSALGESADARGLLFAQGVVLVEGQTELGALPEWFAKGATAADRGTPDSRNVVVFSVDGDNSFGTFVRYLHGLGVPWVIVCDGAVLQFGSSNTQIFKQVLKAGAEVRQLRALVEDGRAKGLSFTDVRDAGARHGIFTMARTWDAPDERFEAYIESAVPGELAAAEAMVGKSKPRIGRHVASVTACPDGIDELYGLILDHIEGWHE